MFASHIQFFDKKLFVSVYVCTIRTIKVSYTGSIFDRQDKLWQVIQQVIIKLRNIWFFPIDKQHYHFIQYESELCGLILERGKRSFLFFFFSSTFTSSILSIFSFRSVDTFDDFVSWLSGFFPPNYYTKISYPHKTNEFKSCLYFSYFNIGPVEKVFQFDGLDHNQFCIYATCYIENRLQHRVGRNYRTPLAMIACYACLTYSSLLSLNMTKHLLYALIN